MKLLCFKTRRKSCPDLCRRLCLKNIITMYTWTTRNVCLQADVSYRRKELVYTKILILVYNFPKDSSHSPIPQWRSIRPRNMQPPTSRELMKDRLYQQECRSILWSCFPADVRILMDPICGRRKLIKEQQRQVSKVLLDGLYDPDSPMSMLLGDHHLVLGNHHLVMKKVCRHSWCQIWHMLVKN